MTPRYPFPHFLGVINVLIREVVQEGRKSMGKRTLILTSEIETILNGESEEKYMKYAKEHNLEISREMHYPPVMSFIAPEQIVDAVMKVNPEIIIAVDVDFIVANAYHDGRFIKMFEDKGISVVNSKIPISLSDLNRMIDDDMLEKLKEAVHYVIEETFKERKDRIVIITNDSSRDEFIDFVKRLSGESKKVCIIEIPAFVPKMSKHIDFCIKDLDVNKVIVYDDKLMTKSMKQYLSKIQIQDHIEVGFMEDYNLVDNQSLNFQGMILN